jgi:hypothetical protein
MTPEPPRLPAVAHSGAPYTSGTGSDRGTSVGEAEKTAQAVDILDAVRDTHTQCDCDECLGTIAAAVLNAAARSLRHLGHDAAADRLDSTAKDLGDGDA